MSTDKNYGIPQRPGKTTRIEVTDTAELLPASVLLLGSIEAKAVLISCELNDIRVAFGGAVPISGADGVGTGHVIPAGQAAPFAHPEKIRSLRVINAVAGADAVIQVTCEH